MYTPDIIRFAARFHRYVKNYITDSLKMRKYYYQRVQKGKVENTLSNTVARIMAFFDFN